MNQLFLTVLNNAITAGFIILAVIMFRICFKKAPKWMMCLLWGVVALKLILPFELKSLMSLIPKANPIPMDIEYEFVPQIDTGMQVMDGSVNSMLEEYATATPGDSVNPMQVFVYVVSRVWASGMIVMIIYSLASFVVLKRKVSSAIKADGNYYECDEIDTPFILGVIKPKIYLPIGLDANAKACVLEHEATHIKRGDHFWKSVGFVILSVYWFNPLCWLAYIFLCKDIELACDEKATKDKDKEWKAVYCQALLDCAAKRRMITACPVAFGEVSVKERVKSVLNYKKPSFWIIIIALLAGVVVSVCFFTNPKDDSDDVILSRIDEYSTVYRGVEYKRYFDSTGNEALFYHSTWFVADIPDTKWQIVFAGEYDEESAQAVILDTSRAFRLQGQLSDIGTFNRKSIAPDKLGKVLKATSFDIKYSGGTAYYVSGGKYISYELDLDANGYTDTLFEIGISDDETKIEYDSMAWIVWVEEDKPEAIEKDDVGESSELSALSEEEVLSMREKVLEDMSKEDIDRLTENIKVANGCMESAYFYDNLFKELEDKDSLYWNYFDEKGYIQIGWDSEGNPVTVYNRFDAENFINLMNEMRELCNNEALKTDLQTLMDETRLAAETHEVEHAYNILKILHDMDYFLLRYGIEDVGKYVKDASFIAKYYGVLSVYGHSIN